MRVILTHMGTAYESGSHARLNSFYNPFTIGLHITLNKDNSNWYKHILLYICPVVRGRRKKKDGPKK